MLKLPFLLIKQALTTLVLDDDQNPALKKVEWDQGQDTSLFKGGLTTTPACLIKFLPITTKQLGNSVQEGLLQFDVRTITLEYQAGDKRLNKPTLDHLEIVDRVYQVLDGYSPLLSDISAFADLKGTDNDYRVFGSLSRTKYIPDHSHRGRFTTVQSFKAHFKDYTAVKELTKSLAPLNIGSLTMGQ